MKKITLFAALAAIMLSGCSKMEMAPAVPEAAESPALKENPNLIHGVLDVKFDDQTTADIEKSGIESAMEEMAGYGITSMERLFPDAGEMEPAQREFGLHRWYRIRYSSVVSSTKAYEGMEDIFPGAIVNIPRKAQSNAVKFNDPYFSEQWGLYNNGGLIAGAVKGMDINVLPVWEKTGGIPGVIVSVVDDGVQWDHKDMSGVILPGGENGSKNFVDENYKIVPDVHGTFVAGIIGAINNNNVGLCGIAGGLDGNGGVTIINSQIFLGDESATTANDAAAIVWGANHGAVISNNSWGFVFDSDEDAHKTTTKSYQSIADAIDYFVKYAGCDAKGNQTGPMKGGLVFFSAGNNAFTMSHPASYSSAIAVGAIGPGGKRATYSNYGDWVDICAPGGDYEAFNKNNVAMILGLGSEGSFYYAEGTSMACPMVSGVAALMVSLYGGPGFTNETLKQMLLSGANYNVGVTESIGPLVDAAGAMDAYGAEEKAPQIYANYTGDYKIKAHEILEVKYSVVSVNDKVTIEVDPGAGAAYSVQGRNCYFSFNDGTGTHTGKYKATITATSGSGLKTVETIDYEILENHAPVIVQQVEDRILNLSGSSFVLKPVELFTDPDGENLNYTAKTAGSGIVGLSFNAVDNLVVKSLADGADTVIITATDQCGKSTELSFRVGSFDDRNGPAAYPNPVTDKLNICIGGKNETKVTIYSAAGVKLFETSANCSVLDPIVVNMGSYAPGRYSALVSYDGNEYVKDIVKL